MRFYVNFLINNKKIAKKIWRLIKMFLLLQRETNDTAGWSSW